ncbi:hypothetical protein, partial [Ferruginibacter sp. HRS2-29]
VIGLAQKNNGLSLKDYPEDNLNAYFDSINNQSKDKISFLTHSYDCYVIFTVNLDGSYNDFEILENSLSPLHPQIRKYIFSLFQPTNGKWILDASDETSTSKKAVFLFSFINTKQSMEERVNDQSPLVEFSLMTLPEEKLRRGIPLNQEKKITLKF